MALSPNVVVVSPGELITAAHLNNIRSNLDRLDTSYAALAVSNVFTGANNFFENNLLVGPSAGGGNPGIDRAGFYLTAAGHGESRIETATSNLYLKHSGTGDVTNGQFIAFYRFSSTVIGSITQASSTTTAYNTTSDERLKELIGPADLDAAQCKLAALEPVAFTWRDAPGDGPQVGFLAQRLAQVAPEAVTEGTGEPGDEGFVPWMSDLSKLVPTLVAAIQALTARVAALEAK